MSLTWLPAAWARAGGEEEEEEEEAAKKDTITHELERYAEFLLEKKAALEAALPPATRPNAVIEFLVSEGAFPGPPTTTPSEGNEFLAWPATGVVVGSRLRGGARVRKANWALADLVAQLLAARPAAFGIALPLPARAEAILARLGDQGQAERATAVREASIQHG